MNKKKTVVLGFLGAVLDAGGRPERWERWRPTVSLCRHEDFLVDRLELLTQKKFNTLFTQVLEDIHSVSPETQVNAHVRELTDPWDFQEVYGALHDFARAYPFDTQKEDYYIHISTGTHVAQICLFLLTEAHYLPGKLLQTAPPSGHRTADPGTYSIIDLDLSRYDRLASRFQQEKKEGLAFLKGGIVTLNGPFNKLMEEIEHVAIASKAPLLLMGPTGAGKSQLARRIYDLKKSRRQMNGPFVEINCATLRGDAAMSTLFGHVKGAFTGAMAARPGLLRAADGGMLFLDEVGELGPDEQAMLLHALEEKRFLPVGADHESKSDFQFIAGTNRDLQAAVHSGGFREDLFSRINLWTFRLPSLRQRREDIEPNVAFELDQFAARQNRNVTFNKEAYHRFIHFAKSPAGVWAGNFRDLNASINRMGTLASGGRITLELVEEEILRLERQWTVQGNAGADNRDPLKSFFSAEKLETIDLFDRLQLQGVIEICSRADNLSNAGRILFSASRGRKKVSNDADRLRKYLLRFGLQWSDLRPSPHPDISRAKIENSD